MLISYWVYFLLGLFPLGFISSWVFSYWVFSSGFFPLGLFSYLFFFSSRAFFLEPFKISQICYCGQISLQSTAVNCSFSDNPTSLVVTFILLAMVPFKQVIYAKMIKIFNFFYALCSKSVLRYGTISSQIFRGIVALEPLQNGGKWSTKGVKN